MPTRPQHYSHKANSGLHRTRRELSGFEDDDYQYDNSWNRTQGEDADDEIDYDDPTPDSSADTDLAYVDNVLHPRSWGNAGRTEW